MKFKDMLEFYKNRICHVNVRDNGRIELTYYVHPDGAHKEIGQLHHTGMITEVYDDFVVFERRSKHATEESGSYAMHHIFPSDVISITRIVEDPVDKT